MTVLDRHDAATTADQLASGWLGALEQALGASDVDAAAALFLEDGHWRDVLAFSWHLHNFSGRELDRTTWRPQTEFVTGSSSVYACYRDDPSNVNVRNGSLNLTLVELKAPAPGAVALSPTRYMSGGVSTYHLFSQQYGRVEARVKTVSTSQPGLHEAFWMWPDDRYGEADMWPASGEIDVAETFSIHPKSRTERRRHLRGVGRPPWRVEHLPAGVVAPEARVLRQRQELPGEHVRRPGVPEALHHQLHRGHRPGRDGQHADTADADPGDVQGGLRQGLGVALRTARPAGTPRGLRRG